MTRPGTILPLTLVVGFLLLSCGIVPPGGTSSEYEAEYGPWLDTPAHPIALEVELSTDHAATALMASNGGRLTATGPDGTTYTLEVPAGSLYAPVEITMTPSADVGGLPFGVGSTFVVQLEPAGLRFSDVAVLTIEPAREIPIEEQVFFSYQGDDNDFYLAPPVVTSAAIQFPIFHFSGYGVSKGLEADIAPVRQRLGGDVEARLQSIAAQELGRERQRQLLGQPSDFDMAAFLQWLLKTYYTEVLKPRLDAANEGCAEGRLALQTLLGMERQAQLLGIEGGVAGALRAAGMGAEANRLENVDDLMKTVGLVCLKEEYELCRDEHVLHRIVPVVLGIDRQQQLLGVSGTSASRELLEKGKEYASRCLRFRLEFESDLEARGEMSYESDMTSTVQLTFDWDRVMAGDAIRGNAPQVNEHFSIRLNRCTTISADRGGSTFEVASLMWDVAFRGPDDRLGYVADLDLQFVPGVSTETYRIDCGGDVITSMANSAMWSGAFGMLYSRSCQIGGGESGPEEPQSQDVPPEVAAMLEGLGVAAGGLSPDQLAALTAALESGGPLPPDVLEGLLSPPASTDSPTAPAVGGLISPPTPGGCSAGRGWTILGGEEYAVQEWDRESDGMHDVGSFTLYHTPH